MIAHFVVTFFRHKKRANLTMSGLWEWYFIRNRVKLVEHVFLDRLHFQTIHVLVEQIHAHTHKTCVNVLKYLYLAVVM